MTLGDINWQSRSIGTSAALRVAGCLKIQRRTSIGAQMLNAANSVAGGAQLLGLRDGGTNDTFAPRASHSRTSRSFASDASTKSDLFGAEIARRTNSHPLLANYGGK